MKLFDREVLWLVFFRGASFAVTLWMVPLSLAYLEPMKYGVWMTLGSALSWLMMFDVGLGNGLRNRLGEALAAGDTNAARSFVSTSYATLALGVLAAILVFELVNPFLSWSSMLNAPGLEMENLALLAALVFAFWGIRLVLGLINAVVYAHQRPSIPGLIDFLSNFFTAVGIVILFRVTPGSLFWYGVVFSVAALMGPVLASVVLFRFRYRALLPSWKYIQFARAKDLSGLGIQFFLLQIAGIVQYSSANILISHMFGPVEVTPFSIAMRYFNIPMVVFATILTPYWSKYTHAYARGDLASITESVKRLSRWWLLLVGLILGMLVLAEPVFGVWVGTKTHVPFSVSVLLGVYVLMQSWCNIFVNVINGTGKVRLQVMIALLTMVLFVPLAYVMAMHVLQGSAGIILAMCLILSPLCVLWPYQARRILSVTDSGVWGR